MGAGLMILNRGTVSTFMDCRRQEVLDITISTGGLADLVRDWRVSGEPSGSDHRQVRYDLRHMVNKEWGRNPRTTNWEGYRMDLEAILKKAPNRFHSEENLEYAAQFESDAIKEAYEGNCLERTKYSTSKTPWWSKELSKHRLEVRRLFNKPRRKNSTADWEAYRKAQRGYSKAIIIAKRKLWRDFCKSIESASEASRLNRILSKDNTLRLGCLKLPNGNYTETVEGSLKHLMSTHFPGFQERHCEPQQEIKKPGEKHKPREWTLAAKMVTPDGVEWAIKTFGPYKTPGPDGI
ncbi:PREDICTED: uncharacterized protein LOC108774392 [Cyphomyrmex costatus]|uniref:uncharacterized protein LOC108774392 n=1 Tax=Cyphomyrmex costatus TaxID=456900 RepID=UPI0008522FD5|nr:PREDICTED: uncharacterized protein LOC108774392 [Cyphomyrmex costatus]